MKHIIGVLLIFSAVWVSSCSPNVSRNPVFDYMDPATVLTLEQDTTRVIISDFFPALSKIDRVEGPGITVLPTSSWDTVMVCLRNDTPGMTTLNVFSERQKASVPIRKMNVIHNLAAGTGPCPRITVVPPTPKEDALCMVKVENAPAYLLVFWQNSLVEEVTLRGGEADSYPVVLPGFTALVDRSYLRVYAFNASGISNDLLIPLDKGRIVMQPDLLRRTDKHTQIMYQVFVDRFNNGDTGNDRRINSPEVLPRVDYYGGDLKGITARINEGFFSELGISTIWLSPISRNPDDAWGQISDPKTKFSAYHGYWPVYVTKIDDRMGTGQELETLLGAAHGQEMNVILDYVANHMHISSPTLKEHPDWVTSNITPDGRPNFELWDEFRLTTWFDVHIPKFDFSRPDVCDALSDSALFWLDSFDIDGFRHDATKHIDEQFWRTLTRKIVTRHPGKTVYQIGETYGSPALIDQYVKRGMLDGQFDFNLYDSFIGATVYPNGSFTGVMDQLMKSIDRYGSHHLMSNISGNHDRARFISLVGGALDPGEDLKLAGWKRDVGVGDVSSYQYLAMLHAFNMTLPGIPCIYYGDEYGMPGANDPDNRRMMKFSNYSSRENELRERVKRLIWLRNNNMALLYGDTFQLCSTDDVMAYLRLYMGNAVIVCLNKSNDLFDITSLELPFGLSWDSMKPYMGETMVTSPGFTIMTN